MASLERRGSGWRIVFMWKGQKRSFTIGDVGGTEAAAHKADAEARLRHLKQGLLDLRGHSIETYLLYKGHPPENIEPVTSKAPYTLATLRDHWMASAPARRLEASTLMVARCHWRHLIRILKAGQAVEGISHADLQRYIDRRAADREPPIEAETIRKELKTLKAAWKWARRMDGLTAEYPGQYLTFHKADEQLPFMTLDQAARVVADGGDEIKVYDSIYLTPPEVADVLAIVRAKKLPLWVSPMFVFAAHTGARRSEMIRAQTSDVDLDQNLLTIRERKRIRGKRSTRRVPITPLLAESLLPLIGRPGILFRGAKGEPLRPTSPRKYFHVALRGSKFSVLRGWHVFRHSYISALAAAGVDQRIIDDLVGHSTEEQRRRYRHLLPNIKAQAVLDVFGK